MKNEDNDSRTGISLVCSALHAYNNTFINVLLHFAPISYLYSRKMLFLYHSTFGTYIHSHMWLNVCVQIRRRTDRIEAPQRPSRMHFYSSAYTQTATIAWYAIVNDNHNGHHQHEMNDSHVNFLDCGRKCMRSVD